jgi:hypothetical protein
MKKSVQLSYIFCVFSFVIGSAILYFSFLGLDVSYVRENVLDVKGVFGDSWGMFTSIFSALGFGGVLITLIFQYTALNETRLEAEVQKKSVALQQFEDVFFRMLTIHTTIINDLDIRKKEDKNLMSTGRDTFQNFYKSYKQKHDSINLVVKLGKNNYAYTDFVAHLSVKYSEDLSHADERSIIGFSFESFWNIYRADLGHYFRFLFNIFKFIEQSHLNDEEQYKYARILRAQLSDYELIILFYNCLSYHGVERFKPIAEKYKIFDNLPYSLVLKESHLDFYNKSAFGKRDEGNVMMVRQESNCWF